MPSREKRCKLLDYTLRFIGCVCVCLIAVGSGYLKKLTGGEWEWSMRRAVMKVHIFHLYTYTHTHTVGAACDHEISVFLCVREIPG